MGFRYDILQNSHDGFKDAVNVSPGIVIGVVALETKNTYDFAKRESKDPNNVENTVKEKLFQIQDRCLTATVVANKSSFTWSFSGLFKDPDNQLYQNICPGDWICVWMLNNANKTKEISQAVAERKAVVGFKDGLKFWGKVETIRRNVIIADNGTQIKTVSITAYSFREFGSTIYFNPALASIADSTKFGFAIALSESISKWQEAVRDDTLSNVMDGIPAIITVFLGAGPPPELKHADAVPGVPPRSPNDSLLVPTTVGEWLGKGSRFGDQLTFSDCLDIHIGVETYGNYSPYPQLTKMPFYNTYKSGDDITSAFSPIVSALNGTVWNILNGWVNSEINEIFPTLRAQAQGIIQGIPTWTVTPTLVVRQQPFTTESFDPLFVTEDNKGAKSISVTRFDSLPRWVISPKLVYSMNEGRTDALRANYSHVIALPPMRTEVQEMISDAQQAMTGFVLDSQDIQRNGLRPIIRNIVAESTVENVLISPIWSALVADWNFGGHLKTNGTMSVVGIVEPISLGDNVEYEDTIYHIVGFTHTFQVNSDGTTIFQTELSLTNGVLVEHKRAFQGKNEPWPGLDPLRSFPIYLEGTEGQGGQNV